MQVGTAGLILQLVFLAYIFWTDKRKIGLGTVLGSMIIAATINAWAPVLQPLLASAPLMIRMVCVIVEPLLVGPALAMIQVSGMGLGPTDTVPVVLCAQLKRFSFRTIRVGYDCLLLLLGALLGGVVGPGTVMPALRIGPSIQFSLPYVIRFSKRYKKDQCI